MKQNVKPELKVFISTRESTCSECKKNLGRKAWIHLNDEKGALCLFCADLDHLVFLPSGDAALTRRTKKYSSLYAVVYKWSRNRKRYERQGLLVEEKALNKAEQECLSDYENRARKNERAALRRAELDKEYIKRFTERIRELYPNCPRNREEMIAEHACMKYSGRIGRSASAKDLTEKAVELAVIAHIRHFETEYDEMLSTGVERDVARREIQRKVMEILSEWK